MPKLKRGDVWQADFTPQIHKEEPGKRCRPALILQVNLLNDAGHSTTVVVAGTTNIYRDKQGDGFPLRVPIGKIGEAKMETDLLIDQIRAISNQRFIGDRPIASLARAQLKRVEEALKLLIFQ